MPSRRTAEQISEVMRRVRGADTAPEIVFRKALHALGLRFRKCAAELPGKPDLALASRRLAIFIDGDLWHGAQWRRRGLACLEEQFPATASREYWLGKIRRNGLRDCQATAELLAQGWTVLRFWESDVRRDVEACARLAARACPAETTPLALLPRLTLRDLSTPAILTEQDAPKGWTLWAGDPGETTGALVSLPPAPGTLPAFAAAVRALPKPGPPLLLARAPMNSASARQGGHLLAVLKRLHAMGYAVDAVALGKMWVVARRRDVFAATPLDVDETGAAGGPRPAALARFIRRHPAVGWRLRRLPGAPKLETFGEALGWLATYYLDPCAQEAMRGVALKA
ncbi:MAG TPA: very short patch repair endonuclease [Candidatus Brocadiia bacterium]|nr:very short patch repair endonuclease [Candidatus Brocadiia bacterium]